MSSGLPHLACVFTVRRAPSQMVGFPSLPQFETMTPVLLWAARNFGSSVMSPALGDHAGTFMFLARSCALVMFL